MTPLDITRNDPLTQIDGILLSISSISEAARFDIALFGHLVYDYCLWYNEFKAYHSFASYYKGSRATYSSTWREKRLKVVLRSQRIRADGPVLYTKWGALGTLRLWDKVGELANWWDAVYMRAEGWTSEMKSLKEPQLAEEHVREEKAKPPKTKLPWFLEDAETAKKADEKPAEPTKPAKITLESTHWSTPGNERRPRGHFENLAHAGMNVAPSTSRAEQRGSLTNSIQRDRPSDRGTRHKPGHIDDPELGGVIPLQSHGRHASTRSATSEITRVTNTMRISQPEYSHASATRSTVQPSTGTTSSYRSEPPTTNAPLAGWDSSRTHEVPEGSW